MSKRKEIINYNGRKCGGGHKKVSRNISEIVGRIEKLDFVKHIIPGDFRNQSSSPKIDIIGYDDKSRKYSVNICGGKFVQKVFLDVSERKEDYEKRIRDCLY